MKRELHSKELELAKEKLRGDVYETLVDIAKEDFNLDLRKKGGAKQ